MGCASVASVLVWALTVLSPRWGKRAMEWLPVTTAAVVAAGVSLTKLIIPELDVLLVTLAAVAVLLPGYTISLGTGELVLGHVVSGAANLVGGLVYLAKQVAGGWLGAAVVSAIVTVPSEAVGRSVDPVWLWLFVPLLAVALCVVFQIARRDLLAAASCCVISYLAVVGGSELAGANAGNLIATVAAVGFARLWSERSRRPALIALLPAIVFLVSGTMGFRGLATMAEGQSATGRIQLAQMFVVALTLTAGLLLGNGLFGKRA